MRERLTGIVAIYKQKNKDELDVSGVSSEDTSLDERKLVKKWNRQISYITNQPRKMQKNV